MSPKTIRNRILQVEFVAPPRTKSAESDLAEAIPELSPRELQCLRLAAKGHTSVGIGHTLGISPRTVDEYVSSSCRKLGVRNRTQAVAKTAALGLLGEETL
jgi:LuxR family transcriptional regulator of spore coat protein